MELTRREMLKIMAATGAVALWPKWATDAHAARRIVAYKGEQAATVRKVVEELGGIKKFIAKGDKVVIKPNMGFAVPPLRSSNTDPIVIRTLAELVLEAGAKSVQILDNPVHPIAMCKLRNGIAKELEDLDDVYIDLVKDEKFFADVAIPHGRKLKRTRVLRAILEADAVINAPMAKSHGGSIVSFSLKNWMGAIKNRIEWHRDINLHQAIADFATYIKPKFTILDATRALTTGGPGGPGEIKHLQTIIGGLDQVAIDSFAVGLATWNGKSYQPADIPHIKLAAEQGVGSMDLSGLITLTV